MSVPTSKAHILLAMTTVYQSDLPFYKPGERAAGPMAMFMQVEPGSGTRGLVTVKQGTRFVRQNKRDRVVDEVLDTGDGTTGASGTLDVLACAPGSLVITTQDDTGFTGAAEDDNQYTDDGLGVIRNSAGVARGTINYFTGVIALTFAENVTGAQEIYATYWPVEIFEDGVDLITVDGFSKETPLEIGGRCEAGSMVARCDLVGKWM